jgi:hypothetical protein
MDRSILNSRLWLLVGPALLTMFGITANEVTMALNGGKMPVVVDTCSNWFMDSRHVCATSLSRLPWLIDRFDGGQYVYSAGDFALLIGMILMLFGSIAWFILFCHKELRPWTK